MNPEELARLTNRDRFASFYENLEFQTNRLFEELENARRMHAEELESLHQRLELFNDDSASLDSKLATLSVGNDYSILQREQYAGWLSILDELDSARRAVQMAEADEDFEIAHNNYDRLRARIENAKNYCIEKFGDDSLLVDNHNYSDFRTFLNQRIASIDNILEHPETAIDLVKQEVVTRIEELEKEKQETINKISTAIEDNTNVLSSIRELQKQPEKVEETKVAESEKTPEQIDSNGPTDEVIEETTEKVDVPAGVEVVGDETKDPQYPIYDPDKDKVSEEEQPGKDYYENQNITSSSSEAQQEKEESEKTNAVEKTDEPEKTDESKSIKQDGSKKSKMPKPMAYLLAAATLPASIIIAGAAILGVGSLIAGFSATTAATVAVGAGVGLGGIKVAKKFDIPAKLKKFIINDETVEKESSRDIRVTEEYVENIRDFGTEAVENLHKEGVITDEEMQNIPVPKMMEQVKASEEEIKPVSNPVQEEATEIERPLDVNTQEISDVKPVTDPEVSDVRDIEPPKSIQIQQLNEVKQGLEKNVADLISQEVEKNSYTM